MEVSVLAWVALLAGVVVLLAIDLFFFARRDEPIQLRHAAVASVLWTALGLAFTFVVLAFAGPRYAGEYLTGFLLEKSLSVDNLFVFALIFGYFGIPAAYQRRVMFWGIVGAIVLRGVFIAAGAAVLAAVHWMIFVFAGFLIVVGVRMALHRDEEQADLADNKVLVLIERLVPLVREREGHAFFVRRDGHRYATPLFGALVMVAFFDAVFALDSIPAIFGVTRQVFLVAAANAFSLLGLAALYFTLAGMLERFRHLGLGIAVVLVLVGVKMIAGEFTHIPEAASLGAIVLVLGSAVAASLRSERRDRQPA
ncbi:MAG TPA: TerC/Alx family metal homeostasis membrane protein [Thermoleophilaceae bacterium]